MAHAFGKVAIRYPLESYFAFILPVTKAVGISVPLLMAIGEFVYHLL